DEAIGAIATIGRGALGELLNATFTSIVSVTLAHDCVTSNMPCHAVAKLSPTAAGFAFIEKPLLLAIQNAGVSVRPAFRNSSSAALYSVVALDFAAYPPGT